jgi:hypothetical protein
VRYFWSRREPPLTRVLLIESGSRHLLERLLPHLRAVWGYNFEIDILTCYPGLPAGYPPESTVFRVSDYGSPEGRKLLVRQLKERQYSSAGMICSGEPIMTKWKWLMAARIPAKFIIINENADYFWVHRQNWATIRRFALVRAGLAGEGSIRTVARLLCFPFTVLFLMLYAAVVHGRRALRQVIH